MEIVVILLILAAVYALLHPLRTLGLLFRFGASLVVLVIILAIIGALSGGD